MAIYCIKIKYTSEAIKGMMEEGAHRADAIRSLTEVLGVKLLAFYGMVEQHYHEWQIQRYHNMRTGVLT